MIQFVLDLLEDNGLYTVSPKEQTALESGIARFLQENGIRADETREYHRNYITKLLRKVDVSDRKAYLLHYHLLCEVNQIVIELRNTDAPSQAHRERMYRAMQALHCAGLGEKYIPVAEVKQLLGRFA